MNRCDQTWEVSGGHPAPDLVCVPLGALFQSCNPITPRFRRNNGLLQLGSPFYWRVGVNALRPNSPLRSLLLCHKTNMLGATLLRVNINTPSQWFEGEPGVSSLWWREGRRSFFHANSSVDMASAAEGSPGLKAQAGIGRNDVFQSLVEETLQWELGKIRHICALIGLFEQRRHILDNITF